MSKTTQQWINEVKTDPAKLRHWLERQFVGEALAADRISQLATSTDGKYKKVLERIASDERKHCQWVEKLLTDRGITIPLPTIENTRYWEPILGHVQTFEDIAAAGHHAEAMRLVRIRALAEDQEIDQDIREVFTKILPDEEFHAKAFAAMSNEDAIERTRSLHEAGLEMLGLEL